MEKRSHILDIIKGVMILFIIVTHYKWNYPADYLKYGFVFYIDMAVPVFMIISSYLYSIKIKNNRIINISAYYSIERLTPSLLRYLIPFLIVFFIEMAKLKVTAPKDIVRIFFLGG